MSDYILLDGYFSDLAAGAVNGSAATPGPGTRRVTDTSNLLSLSRGYVVGTSNASAWNNPDLYYTVADEIGAICFNWEMQGATTASMAMLISPTDRPADPTVTGLGVYTTVGAYATDIALTAIPEKVRISSVTPLRAIRYNIYFVRRPTAGVWTIVSGGIYGTGTLVWVSETDDISTTNYVGMVGYYDNYRLDGISAVKASKLSAPFLTDTGPITCQDTFTRTDSTSLGSTEIGGGAWTETGSGASISNNALVFAANGGAFINLGSKAPRIYDAQFYYTNNTSDLRVYFRCGSSGALADTCAFIPQNAVTQILENGVLISQTGAAQYLLVQNSLNRVRVIDWGTHYKCYLNNVLCFSQVSSTNYDASHIYFGLFSYNGAVGHYVDKIEIWPMALTPPTILGDLPSPCAGDTAIFSDTFTGTNGTLLTAHNSGYTKIGTGDFEINNNTARMTADGQAANIVYDAEATDHEVSATITTPDTIPTADIDEWFSGLTVRYTDVYNYIYCRLIYTSGREIELWEQSAGVPTLISMTKLGDGTLEKNTSYALKLAVKGNEACVYLSGVLVCQSRTTLLTGTKAGLHCSATSGVGNRTIWDDLAIKGMPRMTPVTTRGRDFSTTASGRDFSTTTKGR